MDREQAGLVGRPARWNREIEAHGVAGQASGSTHLKQTRAGPGAQCILWSTVCRQPNTHPVHPLDEHPPDANTGRPRCVDPPFLGFTPPTTCVPYWMACVQHAGREKT